jgi:hypothetical protein
LRSKLSTRRVKEFWPCEEMQASFFSPYVKARVKENKGRNPNTYEVYKRNTKNRKHTNTEPGF